MASPDRFENRRLREESLKAFAKALHTDRMVAITGAMATRALGYPSWPEFAEAYARVARNLAIEIRARRRKQDPCYDRSPGARILRTIRRHAVALIKKKGKQTNIDIRVTMWILHDCFRALDAQMRQIRAGLVIDREYQKPVLRKFEKRIARIFTSRTLGRSQDEMHPWEASVRPLIANLGIKRIATLNYDLEFERAFMLRADERDIIKAVEKQKAGENSRVCAGTSRSEMFAAKAKEKKDKKISSVLSFIGGRETGRPIVRGHRDRLTRTMGNGVHVESDYVDRERPDRLFEFAVGSTEIGRHILHLHGRADVPSSMIANIRQYDRQYRLDDLYREPFDHGLRVLVGGNPTLFVGVGMSEGEINETLQYFVSNVPVRRPAPTFLIWNTTDVKPDKKAEFMRSRRLDFRVRLGIHVLFDEDILQIDTASAPFDPRGREAKKLQALATTLQNLPALVSRVDRRIWRRDEWRLPLAVESAMAKDGTKVGPYRTLGAKNLARIASNRAALVERAKQAEETAGGEPDKAAVEEARRLDPHTLATPGGAPTSLNLIFASAPNGYGRGELGERIAQMEFDEIVIGCAALNPTWKENRLLVNAGFSYDSDAVLNIIAEFLRERAMVRPSVWPCRERYFADGTLFHTREPSLIIINGADRYFGYDGTPLSAELDHMLRCALRLRSTVQFLLLGTERLRPYCEAIGIALQMLPRREDKQDGAPTEPIEIADGEVSLNSRYFDWVSKCFDEYRSQKIQEVKPNRKKVECAKRKISPAAAVHLGRALDIDSLGLNRAFYEAYLSPALFEALKINCPAAFEILRTMCFIGAPVEAAVLLHAPKVRSILAEDPKGETASTDKHTPKEIRERLNIALRELFDLGLLIELNDHPPLVQPQAAEEPDAQAGSPPRDLVSARFGLHRSLATFLRDRHGAPINDAKLATAFNMSLFMSEPSDNYTPEPDFHDELGDLVDSLIGGWHDIKSLYEEPRTLPDPQDPTDEEEILKQLYIHPDDAEFASESLAARSSREASACLRAALSLVRGYYSTSALLKLDRDDRIATAERDGALTEHAQRLDRLINGFGDISIARKIACKRPFGSDADRHRHMGPEPFYADDLVWLHNERGVVALTQGHIFDAREAFSAARKVNDTSVECDYKGHNWRRISINMAATRIERGQLKPAEQLLEEIEVSINAATWPHDCAASEGKRVDAIRAIFRAGESAQGLRGTPKYAREEMLVVGMTTAYRGLIAHMRGRHPDADEFFADGIAILRRLGEQRAFAHFQRHLANLKKHIGDWEEAMRAIDSAINAAQSAKQMDILHRSRVVRAGLRRHASTDPNVRRQALQDIKDALKYAALSDCYRVRIEASASLARHMRYSGDYDTALRYATDSLTIASRYGHSLQKTLLRIEIGQILKARGDPHSGEALLKQAIKIGTNKGYHQALEHVRRARNWDMPASNRVDISITP